MVSGLSAVLVADGDENTRDLLADLLARAGYVAAVAERGEDALTRARKERPALALLDVDLPGISGYEVCQAFREEFGETMPVILLSESRTKPHDRAAGLLIGADDYLAKPFDTRELLASIRRCLVRAALIEESASRRPLGNPFGLTPREVEVLELLAEGLRTAAIADRLVITTKTVSTHVQRILAKLGAHNRGEAVAIARRARLVEDTEPQLPDVAAAE